MEVGQAVATALCRRTHASQLLKRSYADRAASLQRRPQGDGYRKRRGGFESAPPWSARYRVPAADAGKHFPKRVEDAVDCSRDGGGVVVGHILGKHLALGSGMFAIGFDMD